MIIIPIAIRVVCILGVAAMLASACTVDETKNYRLYFLGGQSNMVGYGFVDELPADLNHQIDRVMIFDGQSAFDGDPRGGSGKWATLQPGFGHGFETDGSSIHLSDRFGPELSFGHALATALPDTRIALVKYALGGSGLAPGVGLGSWHPTARNTHSVNQFDHAVRTLENALAERDIDGDGIRDRFVPAGIIWMQGESDASRNRKTAEAYEEHLAQLVRSLRTALRQDDLPVVIGKITDSGMAEDGSMMNYIDTVQAGQVRIAKADQCVELVSITDKLNYRNDAWHYDSDGFIQLGEAFAEAVLRLESNCSQASRS